jgi:hypothetical protein
MEEQLWLLSFLKNVLAEPYCPGKRYDVVWFLNVTPELKMIKSHTDMKVMTVGMEPRYRYPKNYDPELLSLSDRYMGYRNFASEAFRGEFEPFTFPIYTRDQIRKEFTASLSSKRDYDFCCFATHDPNIRSKLGKEACRHRAILAGPFFGEKVSNKLEVQRRCRYELITENDINDYYISEKIGQALVGGCVPVYWGCSRIKEVFSPGLFIDMHDFTGDDGIPDIQAVMAHCMRPEVYEKHMAAIRSTALEILENRLSIEDCLVMPIQRYIDELIAAGWQAKRFSLFWYLRRWCSMLRRY